MFTLHNSFFLKTSLDFKVGNVILLFCFSYKSFYLVNCVAQTCLHVDESKAHYASLGYLWLNIYAVIPLATRPLKRSPVARVFFVFIWQSLNLMYFPFFSMPYSSLFLPIKTPRLLDISSTRP